MPHRLTGGQPIHVLIVDDDTGSRLLMRRALERSGFVISEAADGNAAVAAVEAGECHAVLMDVEMPTMNGYEACRAIRSRPGGNHLPIMMVTGRDDVASINQSYQAGATDFLAKPINWNLLGHRVQYLVRGGRLVQEVEESEARQRAMLDALPDLLLVVDMYDRIVDRLGATENHPFLQGGVKHEQKISELVSGDAARAITHALDDCRVRNERTELEFEAFRDGVERRFETRIVPYDKGRLLVVLRDVTERHRANNRIRELAFFDPLTQLPNRQYLLQLLEEARREAAATGERFAVVRINLDNFKRINDSIGHGAGDALLQAVALRLGTFLKLERDGAVTMPLARLTNDEFAVAIRHLQSDADVQNVVTNVVAAFASPYMIRHRDFFVSCTLGIAIFPDHGGFADELLRTAGLALQEARAGGSNRGVVYSEHMRARSVARLELETELRRALEQNELFLAYQPQIEVASGRIASVEALVRWRHPTRGIVPPDEFIPIAEESGLIVQLSDLVMRQALKQISEWWKAGCRDLRVAVNVSGAQFEAPGFPDWVFAHLDEAGLPGACLELEITESLLMVDEAAAALAVRAVRELGVHVAIDDFGTGYSSLAYLKHFPIEALKIDRSFVADLGRDSNDAAICAAIIAMGRQLGLKIVAEGVESAEQLQFLATHGCTLAQGFYIARPVEAPEMTRLLRIGEKDSAPLIEVPARKGALDVPLADYEADLLLKVAKK
ncbi:MAG: response regulator receiver protein [Steroidobacteraceae bacterium]|jgi:diguanylate cyclase (GGDEF)-like protein|nr:response regulator receiver protein [Steroidobacteraceae bacterium]